VRYRGLKKNTSQLRLLFGLINLYRQRRRLLNRLTDPPATPAHA